MKIACFHKSREDSYDSRLVEINRLPSGDYSVRASFGDLSDEITIDQQLFRQRAKLVGFLSLTNGIILVDDWRLNSSIESKSFIRNHYRVPEDVCFNIYFHDSFEEGLIFCNWPLKTDLSVDELKKGVWVHDYIAEHFEGYDTYRKKLIAKRDALLGVNVLDSVVALEQQIDLLTALLLTIVENRPRPDWMEGFKQAVTPHSVLRTRNVNDLLADMKSHKAAVRELQERYFSDRGAIDA